VLRTQLGLPAEAAETNAVTNVEPAISTNTPATNAVPPVRQ